MMHFDHVGLLVKDCEKATKIFDVMYGSVKWDYVEYTFTAEVMTVGKPFVIKTANAEINGVKVEIIEPTSGEDSYMMEYLRSNGEGLHHIAYRFDTEEERSKKVEELLAQGNITVHASERRPGHKSHYIAAPYGGMVFELFV